MDTDILLQNHRIKPPPVQYVETSSITSGGPRDLPNFLPGTSKWDIWPENIYYDHLTTHSETMDDFTSSDARAYSPGVEIHFFEDKIALLERAAALEDHKAFMQIEGTINWDNRSPDEFVHGIQLALSVDAHALARRYAIWGNQRYPEDKELQKYAQVLAPPKFLHKEKKSNTASKLNRDWFVIHGHNYRGQWVAVKDGNLIGSAVSLQALIEQIGKTEGILLTEVF